MARVSFSKRVQTRGPAKGMEVRGRHFIARIEGTEELRAALADLEKKTRNEIAKAGIKAAGEVIQTEWRERVPVLDANYQRAVQTGQVRASKRGATGVVYPHDIPGVADDEQPYEYAHRLEYGDAGMAAQPSARPAFDASKDAAVEAAIDVMRPMVEDVGR